MLHVATDSGGNLDFYSSAQQHPFYPFTLVAAILSFGGVTYFIVRAEGARWWSLLLAVVVAEVSTVGMIDVYEQSFIVPAQFLDHSSYWLAHYWGGIGPASVTILGMSWVLAAFPWWRRENARFAGTLLAAYVVTMVIWIAIGFPAVESGSPSAYLLNTINRLLSQATLVALVADPRWVETLRRKIRALARKGALGSGAAAP
ncbi:MAG: hypothetical protein L3K09_01505 [Thermoplasmata archaeon]|nr:hypothetical protein [Thermoplasmata archaeon]